MKTIEQLKAELATTEADAGRIREELADAYKKASGRESHLNDCATSVAPAETPGPCDCDARHDRKTLAEIRAEEFRRAALVHYLREYWHPHVTVIVTPQGALLSGECNDPIPPEGADGVRAYRD